MESPVQPTHEPERLSALHRYRLLDSPPDQALDDLTALAAQICDTPIALITLVDADRQWFKANIGLPYQQTRRAGSFCGYAIGQRDLCIVPNAAEDPRFERNPLVTGEAHIRFYAGVPLVTPDGHGLGTLCVMDRVPRHLTPAQLDGLRMLGRQVMAQLELQRQGRHLAESEARLRVVTENARVGLVILRADRRYAYANQTYAELLGLPSADLVGRPVSDVLAPVYEEQVRPRLDQAFAGERVAHELRRMDGEQARFYAVQYEPARDGAGAPVVVGVLTDITEQRSLEAQFQQAQKMEAIGRLAGGVAHDFNNLLTAILGYCELLQQDLPPGDVRQDSLAQIQKAGESAATLTRQLLAFSRNQLVEPTLLDLNEIVSGMRTMLGRLIGEDVQVTLGLQAGLPAVLADQGQVEQVVMNLAVNARDAMPTGGTLRITTAAATIDNRTHLPLPPGAYVVLTMADTGTGMTPEVQERLFEPFFTTKAVGKGTGLGLATVHGIVVRSGGCITVDSDVRSGTVIAVHLPVAPDGVSVEVPAATVGRREGTETVLVAEDADALRDLTRQLLQRQGYHVLVAANATDARRIFEEHEDIDLLLTDVVMPGTSGPELTRELLARRPSLKVVFMSGYAADAIAHHDVHARGTGFLSKPFTSEALSRKLRDVLDR